MLLKKATGGCEISGPGGPYVWENDGDVVEVPDEFAAELLAIRGGGFTSPDPEAAEPAVSATPVQATAVTGPAVTPPAPVPTPPADKPADGPEADDPPADGDKPAGAAKK